MLCGAVPKEENSRKEWPGKIQVEGPRHRRLPCDCQVGWQARLRELESGGSAGLTRVLGF